MGACNARVEIRNSILDLLVRRESTLHLFHLKTVRNSSGLKVQGLKESTTIISFSFI